MDLLPPLVILAALAAPGARAVASLELKQTTWAQAVAFAPDGKSLAVAGRDGTIRLWDMATGKKLREWSAHLGEARSVAFSPDGKAVASGGDDFQVYVWEVATGKPLRRLQGHDDVVAAVAFSPDGNTLASAGQDTTVRLWDLAGGKGPRVLEGHRSWVQSLSFSPDGKLLISGGRDARVLLWDVTAGKQVRRLHGEQGQVWAVAFSPDGRTVASAGNGESLHLWDATTGQELRAIREFQGAYAVAFSPDGRALIGGGKEGVRLWEVATGEVANTLQGRAGAVLAVAFAPDGRRVGFGGEDSAVRIVDAANVSDRPAFKDNREILAFWNRLGEAHARQAFHGVWALADAPGQTLPVLREHLRPAARVAPARIATLIAELDSDQFAVRKKAGEELEGLEDRAEAALKKALEGKPPLEMQRRLEDLQEKLKDLPRSPQRLRCLRSLQVLEHIGSPEAIRLLETLAAGDPNAWLTREARGSLDRLARRAPR
jgi:tricorn protease-like protein